MFFEEIRKNALQQWNEGLNRSRDDGRFSDDFSESEICKIQNECAVNNFHCSFLCSLGDWMNNVSDILYDDRFDGLTEKDWEVLFRYYTRLLLIISEIIEDFVIFNAQVNGYSGKGMKELSSKDIEQDNLDDGELKRLSNFINSVCKHKLEGNNLHVHNHHLMVDFVDFGGIQAQNQIYVDHQDWKAVDVNTTILMPSLFYFIDIVVRVHNKIFSFINENDKYKQKMFELYNDEWVENDEN